MTQPNSLSLRFCGFSRASFFVLSVLVSWLWARAEVPRALPEGKVPDDVRLRPLKDLDGYFPFTPPESQEQWAKRAERVRLQMQVALGLWPMPTKTPLNPVIHGRVERDDYAVEKVYFESIPGFYVTGNLYRPKKAADKMPGVLCPHGHWPDGRFYDQGVEAVRREIARGAERFEEGGRSPLQARCVQLARMGCVVFHYDMIGYADSRQISFDLAHRFAKQRPEMNTLENWGLYSAQAEARLQSVMGLQTYNSIRALDFLLGLPEVDPDRIAVTGASGGGTQTFILGAIDPRPKVAFPAVMVSTAMQGGCTCENACLLRVGTGNIEFAALFAPRPLGLTAADDWTREMETKGFPELKKHYALLGAPDKVFLEPLLHFGHNYNHVSRTAMYAWFNKHLGLGFQEPILERDYKRLSREEMSVWDKEHPAPEGGAEFERKLLRWLTEDSDRQLGELRASFSEYQRKMIDIIKVLIGRNLEEAGTAEFEMTSKTDRGDYLEMVGLLKNTTHGEVLPALFLYPKEWKGRTVLWFSGEGKASLYGEDGNVSAPVRKLLESGAAVAGADLLFQGEFLPEGKVLLRTRRVENPREFAGYTFGYNPTLFARRVHDILTLISFVKHHERKSERVDLIGVKGAGPWVAVARVLAPQVISHVAIDTGGFRFGRLLDFHDVNFLPGGAKYGDLPGILALSAPAKVWIAGERRDALQDLRRVYQAAGGEDSLTIVEEGREDASADSVAWLLQQQP